MDIYEKQGCLHNVNICAYGGDVISSVVADWISVAENNFKLLE